MSNVESRSSLGRRRRPQKEDEDGFVGRWTNAECMDDVKPGQLSSTRVLYNICLSISRPVCHLLLNLSSSSFLGSRPHGNSSVSLISCPPRHFLEPAHTLILRNILQGQSRSDK